MAALLERSALLSYLDFFRSNEDVAKARPDPEIYVTAMKTLGVAPSECLILEDNEHGLAAARASMRGREPKVSLVIPTRDRADLLGVCVRSVLEPTDNFHYEIIIAENGSTKPETFALLNELDGENHISIRACPSPFNYSRINNTAVEVATGQVIGLVNKDIEMISPGWRREILSWAVQDDIGCVGAKLYYSDDFDPARWRHQRARRRQSFTQAL